MEFPEGFLRQSSANPDSVTNGGETRQAYSGVSRPVRKQLSMLTVISHPAFENDFTAVLSACVAALGLLI